MWENRESKVSVCFPIQEIGGFLFCFPQLYPQCLYLGAQILVECILTDVAKYLVDGLF